MAEAPNTWLFGVSPENWEVVKSAHLWAVQTERVRDKLRKGDSLIFYLVGSQPSVFVGAYTITGNWEQSTQPVWPDEHAEGRVKYPWKATLEPIRVGAATVQSLLQELSFVDAKKNWAMYLRGSPANFGHAIPHNDATTILAELGKPPAQYEIRPSRERAPKPSTAIKRRIRQTDLRTVPEHNDLRDMIRWIGEARGLVSETEVRINDYRIDCVWRKPVRKQPDQVWEVQIKGDFFKGLAKLKHAWDLWGSEPFLVTTDEYAPEAKRLLGGTFHEMKDDIRIVHWRDVVKLYNLLRDAQTIEKDLRL